MLGITTKPTDEALLASALNGHEDAWAELVDRYDLQGLNYAYGQVSDYDIATEITQAHWTQLVKSVRGRQPDNFRAFFWTLLKRRVVDWIRKKKRSRELATLYSPINSAEPEQGLEIDHEESTLPDPLDLVMSNEDNELLHRGLMQQTPQYRVTIQCLLLEERSVQETAQILISMGFITGDGDVKKKVYNLDYRAQKDLARRMRELGYER